MTTDRVLGTVREYDEFLDVLRQWVLKLGTTYEGVDEVAGIPARYLSKVLAPIPVKGFGRYSLGPTLGALGIKLLVAIDDEQLDKIRHRLTIRKDARTDMHAQRMPRNRHYLAWKGNPEVARIMQHRWMLAMGPARRKRIARAAARERWHRTDRECVAP